MPIKKLQIKTDVVAAQKKSSMPVIHVHGNMVEKYNAANQAAKEAEDILKDVEPRVKKVGLEEIFNLNTVAGCVKTASVLVEDDTGNSARVTVANAYPAANFTEVADVFDNELLDKQGRRVDVNDCVHEVAVAKFDSNVFLDDNGDFDENRFKAFHAAIEMVAIELGVDNPLTSKTVTTAKPTFHAARFGAFALPQQLRIQQVLPAKVSATPVVAG